MKRLLLFGALSLAFPPCLPKGVFPAFPRPALLARAFAAPRTLGSVERRDARFDALVPRGAQLEVVADGFVWLEGPQGYTIRKFTFKGDNYTVSERTYSTQEGAYRGCR